MNELPWIDIFIIIFIGMGPIKVLLVYIGATQEASQETRRLVARKAVTTAVIVGLILLIAGAIFMRILHFTSGALTIAGGLILLILALNIVLGSGPEEHSGGAPDEARLLSMAIFPMGIPLLLNPVGIVALTVFSAETESLVTLAIIAAMVLAVGIIDYLIFLASSRIDKYLTQERILVMEKLLGILLAALAVQMILNGLSSLGIISMTTGGH